MRVDELLRKIKPYVVGWIGEYAAGASYRVVSQSTPGSSIDLGIVNVGDYGAEGDGTTDDTTSLQAAWDALGDNDVLYFPPGNYLISDTLDFTDQTFIHVVGNRAVIVPDSSEDWTGKAVIDFAGTSYSRIEGVRMEFDSYANPPAVGIGLGRTVSNHGGGTMMINCSLVGEFTHSALYNVGVEVVTFINLNLFNKEDGGCAYFDSSEDDASLGYQSNVSNVEKQFYGCMFRHSVDDNSAVILDALVKEISFRDCYFVVAGGNSNGILLQDGTSNNSVWGLLVDQCRLETTESVDESGIRFLNVNNTGYCLHADIRMLNDTVLSDAIQVNTKLLDSFIGQVQYDNNTSNMIGVANGGVLQRCEINCMYDEAIDVDAGGVAAANLIKGVNDYDTPFTGSGSYGPGRKNTVISTNYIKFVKRLQDQQGFADGDTTPSVASGDYFYVANSSPTSITTLDDGVVGNEVTLYFTNGNTTLVNSSVFKLQGGANWNPPAGSNITMFLTDGYGWMQKSRMSY